MKFLTMIALCLPLLPAGDAWAQSGSAASANRFETGMTEMPLALGVARELRFSDAISSVQIGDPQIADINILSPEVVTIVAKKVGLTNVIFYDQQKNVSSHYVVNVSVARNMTLWVGGKVFPYWCSDGHCDALNPEVTGKDPAEDMAPKSVPERKTTVK